MRGTSPPGASWATVATAIAGGQLDFAPIRLQLAEQQREEAGLAGAVRPHHPDLPPAPDRQVRVPEHPRPAAAQLDAVEPDHGMRSAGPGR